MHLRERTVARQMLVWQVVVVLVLVAGGITLAWLDARSDSRTTARDRALDVSLAVAASPTVEAALLSPDPTQVLQPYAEQVRRDTSTDFVVVMNTEGIRYSHPNPDVIGQRFIGNIDEALAGQDFTERYTGTLGPSVRAVVPVEVDGSVRGLVSVGITTEQVDSQVIAALPRIVIAALGAGAVGVLGAWLVSRRLRRQTHGLGEAEITRMYEYYDAVLRAVREGLLLIDTQGRVALTNDEAARLLDLPDSTAADGRHVADLGLEPNLARALASDDPLVDDVQVVGDRVLVVNHSAATWEGRTVGSVVTLRDRTELQGVTAELDTVQGLADALRAQNHEAANRLHTMVSLIEIGRADDAVAFATSELDLARHLTDQMVDSLDEPLLAAILLGKSALATERGVALSLGPTTSVSALLLTPHETVTVVGNLLDNAIDAAQTSDAKRVVATLVSTDTAFSLRVEDSGPGVAEQDRARVFDRGWSTKSDETGTGRGVGLSLVGQVVRRHGGQATVGDSDLGGARIDVTIGDPT
jgi:sensor histidine kinase regulating citrate/malate metabolism